MSTPAPAQQELLGLFELDDSGTVLYSSLEGALLGAQASTFRFATLKGLNFFTDVVPFTNVDVLRRRFDTFRLEDEQARSFDFTCQYVHGPLQVKILLARVREGGKNHSLVVYISKI